jgi:perosamine synthetase
MRSLPDLIVSTLREVLYVSKSIVPLHEPIFLGGEYSNLKNCIDSTFVSSIGKFVDSFETKIAEYTGAKYAVAVVNGTEALHVALLLAGVKPGNEVLVPSLTFVGTANAVRYCGANPHFVDCEERTLGVDPFALREHLLRTTKQDADGNCVNKNTGRQIKAILPVHVFGHPCDINDLLNVAHEFGLVIVEDAAESLGSWYNGQHTGTFGLLGILSFNGNKIITTGGGGAILVNDQQLALRAKHLTTTAKLPHIWEYQHDELGFNFRMPNLNAALGCAQLEQLPHFLKSKRFLFEKYQDAFSKITGVRLMEEQKNCKSNYWLQTLVLDKSLSGQRDKILEATNKAGFMTRPAWNPIHTLPFYCDFPRASLPVVESLKQRIINLPSSAGLANTDPNMQKKP